MSDQAEAELFGTFLLTLTAAGPDVINAVSHEEISRTAAVAAPGLMALAIILFMGAVAGPWWRPACRRRRPGQAGLPPGAAEDAGKWG